jgi:hypothetical protein
MHENIKYDESNNSRIENFALFFENILRKWDALFALCPIILILAGESISELKISSRGRSENYKIRYYAELGNDFNYRNLSSSSG